MSESLEKRKKKFLKAAKEKFGNKFKYNLDNFIGRDLEIEITEVSTGLKFKSSPKNHLRSKTGIPESKYARKNKIIITDKEFKEKVNLIFGDSLEVLGTFTGVANPIKVLCKKHNKILFPFAKNLLAGRNGCDECYRENLSKSSSIRKVDWTEENINILKTLVNAGKTFEDIGKIFSITGHQISVIAKKFNITKPDKKNILDLDISSISFDNIVLNRDLEYTKLKEQITKEKLESLLSEYDLRSLSNILSVQRSTLNRLINDYNISYSEILEEKREARYLQYKDKVESLISEGNSNFAIAKILGISQFFVSEIESEFNITPVKTPVPINVFDKDIILSKISQGLSDIEIVSELYTGDYALSSLKKFMRNNNITNPNNNTKSHGNEYVKKWILDSEINEFIEEEKISPDLIKGVAGNGIYVDFSLKYNNRIYWIEYNGRQHYEYVEAFHSKYRSASDDKFIRFKLQVQRDIEERNYCKNNNIILVEIPYIFNTYKKISNFLTKVIIDNVSSYSLIDYSNLYKLDDIKMNLEELCIPRD